MNEVEVNAWMNFHQIDYFFFDGKGILSCDSCDKQFRKGNLIIQSDAGDNYCEECST